jgi:hypothetical protein
MKKASLLMVAVLLLGGAMAAQQTGNKTKNTETLTATDRSGAKQDSSFQSNTCFTMRSYLFARNDGEAPRLVGMTTCTPASSYRLYHAQRKPQFGLYPAMVAPQPPANSSAQADKP